MPAGIALPGRARGIILIITYVNITQVIKVFVPAPRYYGEYGSTKKKIARRGHRNTAFPA